ncbi:MAG: hypothetical protein NTW87_31230 [Planctomycetota bacterium]|nr:hypothetical protein [Planctomycetota bacterium]
MSPPRRAQDADSPDAGGGSKHPRTVTPVLVFTRVSGSLGQLVRMAAPLARLPRHVRFYDLGGDLVAVGINGAQPAAPPLSFSASSSGGPAVPTQTARLIARVVIAPASLRGQRVESRLPPAQYEQLRQGGVPESVLHALQQPPAVTEMLNMTPAPARICLDLCPTAEGGFTASGRMVGRIAAPPAAGATIAGKMPQSRTSVFAEALLPLDVRACFLRYLVSQMAPGKDPAMLARGQRRWSHRFSELEGRDVDLDRDLWPAFGHALHFSLEEDKLDPAGYALLSGSVPLAGDVQAAREAAEELIRERWSGDVFDGAIPSHVKPPYVKLVKEPAFDHYLLNTGQLGVPSWVIAPHVFAFTSNVGPYALRDPSSLPRPSAAPAAPPATSYFLWADGPRLAPTVERLATAYYDSLEEDFGNPKEFLAHYPDVPLYVRLWRKLTGLLGRFRLEIRPEAGGEAAMIHIAWTPGTTAVPAPEQTDAAPPPPPAGE